MDDLHVPAHEQILFVTLLSILNLSVLRFLQVPQHLQSKYHKEKAGKGNSVKAEENKAILALDFHPL